MQKSVEINIQYPSKLTTYWNRLGRFCCFDFALVDISICYYASGAISLFSIFTSVATWWTKL